MADDSETTAVLSHHLQAFAEGLDALMSDYTDDSVVIAPEGTYRGMSEIRGFFTVFIEALPEGVRDALDMKKQEVVGECAYILWDAKP